MNPLYPPSAPPSGNLHISLAVVAGVALIGFLLGVSDPPIDNPLHPAPTVLVAAGDTSIAPTYRGLRQGPWQDGQGWVHDTQGMRGPSVLDPVDLSWTDKGADLADRTANRAFDGAPPTIPHAIRQDSAAECLACHAQGLRLRGAVASPVPHDSFTSCTQCHVVSLAPMPGERLPPDATFVANGFQGMATPFQGERWVAGLSPPVIPHRTTLREQCMSCHGPNGRDALRSSHPDRQSCTQCHALSAEMDQRPDLVELAPWTGELR